MLILLLHLLVLTGSRPRLYSICTLQHVAHPGEILQWHHVWRERLQAERVPR